MSNTTTILLVATNIRVVSPILGDDQAMERLSDHVADDIDDFVAALRVKYPEMTITQS